MKKLILGLVVCALMAAPALANITILKDYPGAAYTHTVYGFTTGVTQYGSEFVIGYDSWQTNMVGIGTPSSALVLLSPSGDEFNGWYKPGYVYSEPVDPHTISNVEVAFQIPNLYRPDLYKLIQVEIVYQPNGDGWLANATLVVPQGNISLVSTVYDIDPETGLPDVTLTWKVWPQPEWEKISITMFSDWGIGVDSVEVATVCIPIPAPAAVILGSIGTVLVGWLRRRKCL